MANSITITEQDSVKFASGFVALGTTGALVLGHVVGLVTKEGVGLETTGIAGAATGTFAGAYLTASDNQTVGMVKAMVDISKASLYSAEEDATIGTTTGSNLAGYTQDIADEDTLDESTAVTTTGQYMGWGVDSLNTAQAIVNIFESQVFGV
ncbi:MAG TPA: hypothetical protein PKV66_01540 [Candidatus Pelethenecus sp.]|nr:hypothetical protein [Candidatus Pelethenecus sp.]